MLCSKQVLVIDECAICLQSCWSLSDASQLWHKYQDKLAEDFFRHAQLSTDNTVNERLRESLLNRCLLAIQDMVISIGGNSILQYGMPEPSFDGRPYFERINRNYAMEINYDLADLAETLQTDIFRLTDEQRLIFEQCFRRNTVCRCP